jgi:hypothetical protein
MTSLLIANTRASVAFSSALTHSCMSLSFWDTNQRPYGVNRTTVDYSVTTQTPQGAFTTVIAFYVCEDIGLDIVLGQDYTEHCSAASGALPVFKPSVLFS